jgi:hypothetical protein
MDKNLLEELANANIHATYMESRLFQSDASIKQLNVRELADLAFVSTLGLYICYYQAATRSEASNYASRIIDFYNINQNFSAKRIQANDLYLAYHGLTNKNDSMVSGKLRPNSSSDIVWGKISINYPMIRALFSDMSNKSLDTRGYISRILFNLENNLYITDSTLRQLRRNAQEWYQLGSSEKVYTIARITSWIETHGSNMDILPMIKKLARSKEIDV